MKNVAICLVTFGVAMTAPTHLRAAETPAPASKPGASIIITNKADSSVPPRGPYLSAGLPEIVKMHKAGVDAAVLLAYVQNSPTAYHPSAKEIIYLRDQGLSSEIISAMLRRGGELRDRAAEAAREERSRATPPPAPTAPATPAPQSAAPAPVVVYANPVQPVYTTPSYVYPAYSYSYWGPAYYNYSCYRPYYNYSYCRPYYRPSYYGSAYVGYRSGCYSGWGLSAGYRGGHYYGHGGGSYYGHSGGYRTAGGWHGGGAYRRH